MRKLFLFLFALLLFCAPVFAQALPGQVQTITPGGIPIFADHQWPPSVTATFRSFQAVFVQCPGIYEMNQPIGGWNGQDLNAGGTDSFTDSTGNYCVQTSGTGYAQPAGHANQNALWPEMKPRFGCHFKTGPSASDIQNCRIKIGFVNNIANEEAADNNTAGGCAIISYCTGTDSTAFWRIRMCNGTSINVITTTYPIATNTSYNFGIDNSSGTNWLFYINGTLVASTNVDPPPFNQPEYATMFDTPNVSSGGTPVNILPSSMWEDFL